MDLVTNTLTGIGGAIILGLTWKLVDSIYKTFLRPAKKFQKLGKWAVITGATDGIGRAYALALAKKGMGIVLISRTESKLQQVQAEIEQRQSKESAGVKYIVCDYSSFDKAAQENIRNELEDLDVGILINNIGVSYRYPRFFHELSDEEVESLISLNIDSAVWMTRIVLPGMLQRKRGAIVNLSSGSGLFTVPLLSEYGAAKGFLEKFSRSLNAEYMSKGVTVQCQVPFYVATKLAKLRRSFSVPTPEQYAAVGIRWIGYPDAVVSPFWVHALQTWIMKYIPDFIMAPIIFGMHMQIRKKGLSKDQKTEDAKKEK